MNRILVERMKERMGNSLRLLIFRPVNSCISTVRAGLGGQNGSKLFSGYANENNKVFEELDFPYYFVGKKLQDRLICQTLAQAVVRGDSDVFDKWRMFRYRQMLGISYFLYHTSGTIIQSLILSQSRAQCIVRGETDLLAEAKQRRSIQIYINNKAFEKSYFPYEKSYFPYSVGKKTQKRLICQSLAQAVVCGDSDIFNNWRMFRYQKMLSRSIFPYNSSGMRIQTLLLRQRQAQCVVLEETGLLAEVKLWLSLQIYSSVQGTFEIGFESCSKIIHVKVWKTGHWKRNSLVISVVVNAYGNAGMFEEAQQFFLLSGLHGFFSHNAMLWTDAINTPHVAPKRFYRMLSVHGFSPSRSTIQAVLFAADVGGMVFEAAQILIFLKKNYGIARYQLTIHHYTSLLAMLMRADQFDNAMKLLDCMPYKVTQEMINAVFGLCKSNEEAQTFVNYLVRKRVRYMILPQTQLLFIGVTWINCTIAQPRAGVSMI